VFIIIANIVHEIKGATNIFDTSDPCVKHIIANASVNIKTQHEKVLDFLHEYTKIQRERDKIVKTYILPIMSFLFGMNIQEYKYIPLHLFPYLQIEIELNNTQICVNISPVYS
jgi:hypothetical protein